MHMILRQARLVILIFDVLTRNMYDCRIILFQVCYGFYKKFSREDEIEAARTETILRIAQYVKTHPHARPHELRAKLDDEINLFRVKLQSIQ